MTQRTCIAIVDASRARLFLHEWQVTSEGTRDELVEREDLVSPGVRLSRAERFADRRDAHDDNTNELFARTVSTQLQELARHTRSPRVIVCASHSMLGLVRKHLALPRGTTCDELPKDLVKLAPAALRAQLATYGVLPELPARSA